MYDFEHVYFHELYNVKKDPFQMKNIYSEQSGETKVRDPANTDYNPTRSP